MATETLHQRLTPAEYDALMEAAQTRAQVLRREALDALWCDMGTPCRHVPRAAQRLAYRLARHVQQRQNAHTHPTPGA
mgnify:FL=1